MVERFRITQKGDQIEIQGIKVDPKEFGLSHRVAVHESLIMIPKKYTEGER